MILFEDQTEFSVARALRDRGWTVEPPRQVTPESLTARGTPSVFAPAEGIISVSRGDNDATIDMTPEQAREVAERLVIRADFYNEDKEQEDE